MRIELATISEKLEAIDARYQYGSKRHTAASYIVANNLTLTPNIRKAMCQEIPIKQNYLQTVITDLTKMGLYPPQETYPPPETLESSYQSHSPVQIDELIITDILDTKPKGTMHISKEDYDEWMSKLKAAYNDSLTKLKAYYDDRLVKMKAVNDDDKVDIEIVRNIVNFKKHKESITNYPTDEPYIILSKKRWDEVFAKFRMYESLDDAQKMPKEETKLISIKRYNELKSTISELSLNNLHFNRVKKLLCERHEPFSPGFLKKLCKEAGIKAEDIRWPESDNY